MTPTITMGTPDRMSTGTVTRVDLLELFGPAWAVVLDGDGRVAEIIPNPARPKPGLTKAPHARPKPNPNPDTEQMLSRIVFGSIRYPRVPPG